MQPANALIPQNDVVRFPTSTAAMEDPFGVGEVMRILQRRLPLIMTIFVVIAAIGAFYVMTLPPRYQASALLQVGAADASDASPTPAMPSSDYVSSQVELLQSRAALEQLAIHLRRSAPRSMELPQNLVQELQRSLTIERRGASYVIEISATAKSPALAAAYANGLAEAYFTLRTQSEQSRANAMQASLRERLAAMQTEVQQSDRAVIDYRRAHGLQFVEDENDLSTQTSLLRSTLNQARGDLADVQIRAQQGASGRLAGTQNEVLAQLRAREAEAAQREADLSQRYGSAHPTLQAVRAELVGIRQQIAAENARQSASLNVQAAAAQARVAAIESNIASASGQALGDSAEIAHLRQLQREALVARNVYETQLQRYNALGAYGAPDAGDVQLVASASDAPNQAPSHRLSRFALIAAFAAVAAALIAYLLEKLDHRLAFSDDVPRQLGLPILAEIPRLSKKMLLKLSPQNAQPAGFLAENPQSGFAEAMRILWVNLSHGRRGETSRVITVTSALSGEGKTSTALCLARTAVSARCRVILVDCDIRRRSLNHCLGIEPKCGVIDVLSGRYNLNQAIGRDTLSGADILPATAADHDAAALFSTNAMQDLLRQLSDMYDLVILDTAPILSFAEGRSLAALSDGVLLVTRSGKSNSQASREATLRLESVGANILGVVFNAAHPSSVKKSYAAAAYFDYAQKSAVV